jgi:hypothetical protein
VAELAFPALALVFRLAERVLCEVRRRRGRGVGCAADLGTGGGDVLAQHEACVREHDDAEVEADGPQGDDDAEAVHALGREDGVAQAAVAGCAGWGIGGRAGQDTVDVCGGRGDDVDVRDVVVRAREAGCVGDGVAGCGRAGGGGCGRAAVVLREDEEPGYAEEGGVGEVDGGVEDVEPGESEAVEGGLGADVGSQQGGQDEGEAGVDVHAQLDGGEVVAGEQGEDAVQARDFVEEEGERDEGCAGREGHGVEEFLAGSARGKSWEIAAEGGRTWGRGRRRSRAEM